jgi:hypothetical protein
MPVQINDFEVLPAPAPASSAGAAPAASAPPAAEPGLPQLAQVRSLAVAQRELQLRTFAH